MVLSAHPQIEKKRREKKLKPKLISTERHIVCMHSNDVLAELRIPPPKEVKDSEQRKEYERAGAGGNKKHQLWIFV